MTMTRDDARLMREEQERLSFKWAVEQIIRLRSRARFSNSIPSIIRQAEFLQAEVKKRTPFEGLSK